MGIVFAFTYLIASSEEISKLGWKAFLKEFLPNAMVIVMVPSIFIFGAYAVLVGISWFEANIDPWPPLGIGVCFIFLVYCYSISQMVDIDKISVIRLVAYALAATVTSVSLAAFVASVDTEISVIVLLVLASVPLLLLSRKNPADEDNDKGKHEQEQQTGRIIRQTGEPAKDYKRPSGSVWLQKNRALLPPQQWSAANENGLIASDPDFVGLMEKLKELDVPLAAVTIDFNETNAIG